MNKPLPNSLAAKDIAYHLHPYTNAVKHEAEGPLILTEGKGIHVYDENGTEYICLLYTSDAADE